MRKAMLVDLMPTLTLNCIEKGARLCENRRYLKYDYRKEGFTDKNELNGPFLQTGITF
jgi:hypothetical protein